MPHKYLALSGPAGLERRAPIAKKPAPAVDKEAGSEEKLAPTPTLDQDIPDIQTLIVQNPGMNAVSFFNLLKSKGFQITREAVVSQPALDRAAVKKESIHESGAACRMIEAEGGGGADTNLDARYQNRFRAILIQEGLGNTKDGYYYTKEALQSSVPIFEGRKFYADHPSAFEEEVQPERSVQDVYGHFENIKYVEAKDGTGQIQGDIVVLADPSADWVRGRLVHAIDYAKKYPDKDFLGLSINASGDATPMNAQEFLQSAEVVESAKGKLSQAIAEGLAEVKIVKLIDSAVSCDLVTEAGAKGKILQLLEAEKMAKKEKKEAEEKKEKAHHEADPAAADAAAHDDVEQDKALILDMLKKHGLIKGDDDGEGEEEAEEAFPPKKPAADGKAPPAKDGAPAHDGAAADGDAEHADAEEAKVLKAAMHYHQAYKQAGHDTHEAASRAVEAMKCAKVAHAAMESEGHKEAEEKHEAEEKKEKHKESADAIKLRGENASLKERLAKLETEKYLDKKLQESKLPMSVTKRFRESIKGFKSQKDVDEKFCLFIEGYKAIGGEAGSLGEFVMTEKNVTAAEEGFTLDDCVEE